MNRFYIDIFDGAFDVVQKFEDDVDIRLIFNSGSDDNGYSIIIHRDQKTIQRFVIYIDANVESTLADIYNSIARSVSVIHVIRELPITEFSKVTENIGDSKLYKDATEYALTHEFFKNSEYIQKVNNNINHINHELKYTKFQSYFTEYTM